MGSAPKLITQPTTPNYFELEAPWNTTDPIEVLWAKTAACSAFDTTIPPDKLVCVTSGVIEATGLFTEDIKQWKRCIPQKQTMDNLKLAFNQANKERLTQATTARAGYHAAAVQAIANEAVPAAYLAVPAGAPMFYCWSHGLCTDRNHTSATCPNPLANHNPAAVASNMLGGHNYIARLQEEYRIQVNPNHVNPYRRPRPEHRGGGDRGRGGGRGGGRGPERGGGRGGGRGPE